MSERRAPRFLPGIQVGVSGVTPEVALFIPLRHARPLPRHLPLGAQLTSQRLSSLGSLCRRAEPSGSAADQTSPRGWRAVVRLQIEAEGSRPAGSAGAAGIGRHRSSGRWRSACGRRRHGGREARHLLAEDRPSTSARPSRRRSVVRWARRAAGSGRRGAAAPARPARRLRDRLLVAFREEVSELRRDRGAAEAARPAAAVHHRQRVAARHVDHRAAREAGVVPACSGITTTFDPSTAGAAARRVR